MKIDEWLGNRLLLTRGARTATAPAASPIFEPSVKIRKTALSCLSDLVQHPSAHINIYIWGISGKLGIRIDGDDRV